MTAKPINAKQARAALNEYYRQRFGVVLNKNSGLTIYNVEDDGVITYGDVVGNVYSVEAKIVSAYEYREVATRPMPANPPAEAAN